MRGGPAARLRPPPPSCPLRPGVSSRGGGGRPLRPTLGVLGRPPLRACGGRASCPASCTVNSAAGGVPVPGGASVTLPSLVVARSGDGGARPPAARTRSGPPACGGSATALHSASAGPAGRALFRGSGRARFRCVPGLRSGPTWHSGGRARATWNWKARARPPTCHFGLPAPDWCVAVTAAAGGPELVPGRRANVSRARPPGAGHPASVALGRPRSFEHARAWGRSDAIAASRRRCPGPLASRSHDR